MTSVVNKRTHSATKNDVYIGRPSKFGNPFVIGKDGSREEVVLKYKRWLHNEILNERITYEDLEGLKGKNLVCWCSPLACHGDVLVKAVKYYCN